MKIITKNLMLDNQQIDDLVENLESILSDVNFKGNDFIRLKLTLEEVLLNFQTHFGKDTEAQLTFRSRLGFPTLTLSVAGEAFNPFQMNDNGDSLDSEIRGLLHNIGLSPGYQYKHGRNTVLFPLPKKEINSAWYLVVALFGALLLGIIGTHFSVQTRDSINIILSMLNDILFGLIGMFAAPMVFFTMIIGVCEIGDISQLKSFGKHVLSGYLFPYAIGLIFCIALPFLFPLTFGETSTSGGALQSIADALSGIFPSDFVSPFANSDFAQIVVTAIILGIGTLILAPEVPTVISFVTQVNRIISMLLDRLCMLIPVVIFITVVQMIWSGEINVIVSAWKPIVFSVLWLVILLAWQTVFSAKVLGESIPSVLKKILSVLIIGISTGSISTCYSTMDRCASEEFHADKKTTGFALPIGMMIFGVGDFVEFLALSVYFGYVAGVEVTASWLLLAVILSFIFSIAIPPVAGGPVVVLSILLALLDVPSSYIGVAGAVGLLMDYLCTAVRASGIVLVSARVSKKQSS